MIALLVATVFPLCGSTSPGVACTCVPGPPLTSRSLVRQAAGRYHTVLEGTVVNVEYLRPPKDSAAGAFPLDEVVATIRVMRSWRGDRAGTVVVRTALQTTACGLGFRTGDHYLLFAREGDGKLYADKCGPSRTWDGEAKRLAGWLGRGQVAPVSDQTEPPKLPGGWQLRLWVTGPAAESAGPREARGHIEVRRPTTGPVPRGLQWVYSVTYDTTLHPMLGPPKSGPARAVLRARDSVELVFHPLIDHGAFRLSGVVRGDSIIGSWHRTSFANDGYRGSFTMVRRVAGQRREATVPVPPEFRRLEELGELRLKRFSIHGYAPLVVLFTEAPASASEVERRYRHRLTTLLMWSIERLGVSLFSLNPTRHSSDSSDVGQMKHAASAAGAILRGLPAADRAHVFVGFADGAVAAARVLLRDSLSAALVALAPGTPGSTQTQGQEVVWQELLRPVDHPRDVLVLESMCNSPTSALAEARFRQRQTVLMLPQYDGWLSRRMSSACPASPAHAVGMDHEVISIVTDWLKRAVVFPQ